MATYQKWDQSYTPKVQTIRLSYRGVSIIKYVPLHKVSTILPIVLKICYY